MYDKKKINIDSKYQEYLEKIGLDEKLMGETQKIETKKAFFAGFSQAFIMFSQDIASLSEEDGIAAIEDIKNQLMKFACEQVMKDE